jgi:hypothetical protein
LPFELHCRSFCFENEEFEAIIQLLREDFVAMPTKDNDMIMMEITRC